MISFKLPILLIILCLVQCSCSTKRNSISSMNLSGTDSWVLTYEPIDTPVFTIPNFPFHDGAKKENPSFTPFPIFTPDISKPFKVTFNRNVQLFGKDTTCHEPILTGAQINRISFGVRFVVVIVIVLFCLCLLRRLSRIFQ